MSALAGGLAKIGRRVKRAAARALLARAAALHAKASDRALKRVWKLLESITTDPGTRFEARRMRYLLDANHPAAEWLRRIARRTDPNCARKFIENLYGNAWFLATDTRERFREEHGFLPPWLFVFDVTMKCNLRCEGCWAGSYREGGGRTELSFDEWTRVLREARDEMGIHFFVVTGGEPFARGDSWRLYEEFGDCQFHVYTNATLVDEAAAERLRRLGNCQLMISVEGSRESTDRRRGKGVYDKTARAMELLREKGVMFGFSATPTRLNWDEIMSDAFVGEMVDRGCVYGWFFQYIPVGRDPDTSLMVPPDARNEMKRRLYDFRARHPIFLVDFWNDGPEVGGCMAGGRMYFHVTAYGDVEPCVFVHCATTNVRDSSLVEALKSPLFTSIRKAIPYEGNLLRPCMIIDRPHHLRGLWRKHGARPTHPGADNVLDPAVARELDEYARKVAEHFDPAWAKGDYERLWPAAPEDYV